MTEHSRLGPGREFDLIRSVIGELPDSAALVVGPGDDAAVFPDGWVVSTDASVENVHFQRAWLSPEEIGARAVTVALSDLAAMAAEPIAVFVSLVMPKSDYDTFGPAVLSGAVRAGHHYRAALGGGDTTRSDGPLTIAVSVFGRAARPVLRSGALPGDEVWVTGALGAAAAAVRAWSNGNPLHPEARAAFARPTARIAEALWLSDRVDLHALIDLSDGLASDAGHIAAASRVALRIATGSLPIHEAAGAHADAVRLALTGGDDYELCCVAGPGTIGRVQREFEQLFRLGLTRVGVVEPGDGVHCVDDNGRALAEPLTGFDHFADTP
ncbi:MAG: thiamine-phosphate kinase [Gemmatimonadota bacterium]